MRTANRRILCLSWLIFLAAWAPAGLAMAEEMPMPRLKSIFPGGVRQGTSIEITFEGENLDETTRLYCSHPGVTAEMVPQEAGKPLRFKVSVAADVPVGCHDVRTVGKFGISNPRALAVSDRDVSVEQEPNNEREKANRVTLDSTVCGRVNPGEDVDWFVFTAQKGQRVIIECWGSRFDSKLDGCLWLFDAAGKQIGFAQDESSRSEKLDPLLDFDVPADGDYYVRFADFLYGGDNERFYRLQISTAPQIDFVMPTGVRVGESTPVTIYGRNLPGGEKTDLAISGRPLEKLVFPVSPPAEPLLAGSLRYSEVLRAQASLLNGMELRLPSASGMSNARLLVLGDCPEILEHEPNNKPEEAQRVELPCAVSGQFMPAKDVDYFVFGAKKDEPVVISVDAQRIGSPVDVEMELRRPQGGVIGTQQDDGENIGHIRFTTSGRDIRYELNPPEDGDYKLSLEHLFGSQQGGPQYVYRLKIGARRRTFSWSMCHRTKTESKPM